MELDGLVEDVTTSVRVWLKRGAGFGATQAYATALQRLLSALVSAGHVSPRAAEELRQALHDYAAACTPPPEVRP